MFPLGAIAPSLPSANLMPRLDALAEQIPGLQAPNLTGPAATDRPASVSPGLPSGDAFGSILGRFVQDVNARQAAAGEAVRGLQTGENVSLHQAVIAMEEASVSFQLMVEMRNKLLEAYQELMRMQI
ncbi:MAG TPA: flagellar hook-basal body complex protein FliE [Verrucomicrobiae bacterium]